MFAIIETGGKQYKVEKGTTLEVERLDGNAGDTITLSQVLLINDQSNTTIGKPMIEGAGIIAKIVDHKRGEKIRVFKMKAKDHYQKTKGHRQGLTTLEITDIKLSGVEKQAAKEPKAAPETPKKAPKKVAETKKPSSKKASTKKAKPTE